MSLALIQESAREVRRLSVAGSRLAIGDFRLQKLISSLEQAGANVPVFAQVAKGLKDLVNGSEADSAGNLLALSTLLNAILYTQGQTSVQGNFTSLEECAINGANTKSSARALRPIIQALTSSGAGRLELIKTAIERGMFKDLRLIQPSIRGLEDSFPEIADLVADKVLPGYGIGIVPLLREGFDIKGKKSDARRLLVMHRLDANGAVELCKKALDEGSAEVKVAAIECLGQHEDYIAFVLEEANSKNKQVRAAALEALAPHDRPEVVTLFETLIKGKAHDILARPFRRVRNPQLIDSMIGEATRAFKELIRGDSDQIGRYLEAIDCISDRNEPEIVSFFITCLDGSDALAKVKPAKNSTMSGVDVLARLVALVYRTGSDASRDAILAKRNSLPAASFSLVLQTAVERWSPEKVFQEFSPLLTPAKGAAKQLAIELNQIIFSTSIDRSFESDDVYFGGMELEAPKKVVWDPRWADVAIKHDHPTIVIALAQPGHKGCIHYLVKLAEERSKPKAKLSAASLANSGLIIKTLARCQYPKVTDVFLDYVTKKTKGAKGIDYDLSFVIRSAKYLPIADLPRLDEFATKLDEKFVDYFLEALQPLREAAQASQQT